MVAFGDMPNDVPMLLRAGHGVAMGNAHPERSPVADEVTAANTEDGVARVLERWWLCGRLGGRRQVEPLELNRRPVARRRRQFLDDAVDDPADPGPLAGRSSASRAEVLLRPIPALEFAARRQAQGAVLVAERAQAS